MRFSPYFEIWLARFFSLVLFFRLVYGKPQVPMDTLIDDGGALR